SSPVRSTRATRPTPRCSPTFARGWDEVRSVAEVAARSFGEEHHEQAVSLRGDDVAGVDRATGADPPFGVVFDPSGHAKLLTEWGGLGVATGGPAREPAETVHHVHHAEQLVERERDEPAVHVPRRSLVER